MGTGQPCPVTITAAAAVAAEVAADMTAAVGDKH